MTGMGPMQLRLEEHRVSACCCCQGRSSEQRFSLPVYRMVWALARRSGCPLGGVHSRAVHMHARPGQGVFPHLAYTYWHCLWLQTEGPPLCFQYTQYKQKGYWCVEEQYSPTWLVQLSNMGLPTTYVLAHQVAHMLD